MDLDRLIRESFSLSDERKRIDNGKYIGKAIQNGELKLIDLMEALGPKLTDPDVESRVLGITFLSIIFETIQSDFLTSTELEYIVDFLHDRLNDQHFVVPKVVLASLPIIKCKKLPEGCSSKLLRQLFQEANIQSQTYRHRHAFFLIIQYVLENRLQEIKEMGADLVMGFLQSMEGEKDPRNLSIIFYIMPLIMNEFPFKTFTEEIFEVLSMYFPLDFNPDRGNSGDSAMLRREDLAKGLHLCLSHTNAFAEFLIPMVLEKLESNLIEAKLDSLKLLEMCCERSFNAEDLHPYMSSIWTGLRREIFMGGNVTVETEANNLIRLMFRTLSYNKKILESALKLIFTECQHHLSEPELRLSQPASRILTSAARGSEISCTSVLSLAIPVLYNQFLKKTSNPERRGILGIMITMISEIKRFPEIKLSSHVDKWDEILCIWFTLVTHSMEDFVILSLRAFQVLLTNEKERNLRSIPGTDFELRNRNLLQAHLLNLLSSNQEENNGPINITSRVIDLTAEFASSYPVEFLETSTSRLFELEEKRDERHEKYMRCLGASAAVSLPVARVILPRLVKMAIQELEERKAFEQTVVPLSLIIQSQTIGSDKFEFLDFIHTYVPNLIRLTKDARDRLQNFNLYSDLVEMIRIIMRSARAPLQQTLIDEHWNSLKDIIPSNATQVEQRAQMPGLLREGILGSIRPSIQFEDKVELTKHLLRNIWLNPALESRDKCVNSHAVKIDCEDLLADIRLCSTFLNKAEEPKEFPTFLDEITLLITTKLEEFRNPQMTSAYPEGVEQTLIQNEECSIFFYPKRLVTFLMWTVKALAMRGYSKLDEWIEGKVIDTLPLVGELVTYLSDSILGPYVANGFEILVSDSPESLNAQCHGIYKFLYKQRIFQLSVPLLVQKYKEAKGSIRSNYIRALTVQLRHLPLPLLQFELNNVVPLLIGSLEYNLPGKDEKDEVTRLRNAPNALLIASCLKALLELLTTTKEESTNSGTDVPKVDDYFMDLVPRLLKMSQYKGFMDVRISALKCLHQCARSSEHLAVLTCKDQVVRELRLCLDDPKRLVRKEAVQCRNFWILTGAIGGL